MSMENLSYEELVNLFGEDVAKEMIAQRDAQNGSGGNSMPFPLLKKVSDPDSELGAFGTFVFGVKFAKERDEDGEKIVEDKGTNIGKEFRFAPINVKFRYKQYVKAENKTNWSNVFDSIGDMDNAVDFRGNPLPSRHVKAVDSEGRDSDARRVAGWKMVKIVTGLVEVDGKWVPITWEVDGSMYFSYGELTGKLTNQGNINSILNIKTKMEKSGTTKYPVIDCKKSTVETYDLDFFKIDGVKDNIADITTKMKEFTEGNQYRKDTAPSDSPVPAESASGDTTSNVSDNDNTNW